MELKTCPKCEAPDYCVRKGDMLFWVCWKCGHTEKAKLEDWKKFGVTNEEWLRRVTERQ